MAYFNPIGKDPEQKKSHEEVIEKVSGVARKILVAKANDGISAATELLSKASFEGIVEFGLKPDITTFRDVYFQYVKGLSPQEKEGCLTIPLNFALVLAMYAILLDIEQIDRQYYSAIGALPWGDISEMILLEDDKLKELLKNKVLPLTCGLSLSNEAIPPELCEFLDHCSITKDLYTISHIIDWSLSVMVLTRDC